MKKRYAEGGDIYTAEMGQPPTDPEGVPATKKAAPKPAPKKTAPPKDTVFREGMPVPQDIDGASARKTKKIANGGYVRAADGCATKGKTRGTMVKMAGGGYC
jgi:hypothetical protein